MILNVIVPAYNEKQNVPYFYGRAKAALDSLGSEIEWNMVFVNNSSWDGTMEQVLALRASDPRVKLVTLSRNFGYHAALLAGLTAVDGDYYAIVDVDCEDPPELIVDFYKTIKTGTQVVYGVRSNRDEPQLVTFARRLFYIANRKVADSEIVMWMGEFSMITRQVRDAILVPKSTFVSLRAELGHVGFPRVGLPYQRAKRQFGETHYNFWRMTVYAVASILSATTFPLRLVLYLGALVAVAFPLAVVLLHLSAAATGVLAAIVSLYFLIVSLPLLSLYMARTYKNVAQRATFIIDWSRTYL